MTGGNRAAWVASKYGTYPSRVQSAACEVAILDLVRGGKWGLYGSATNRRLKALTRLQAYKVRKLARTMLEASRTASGPYNVWAAGSSAQGTMQVGVTAASGVPVSGAAVRVTGPTGGASTGVTDASGSVTVALMGPMPQGSSVSVQVLNMPRSVPVIRSSRRGKNRWLLVATKEHVTVTSVLARRGV